MPRTVKQNEKIRQATRATIVDSAMTQFAQHGYAHTTIRSIAGGAGISTGLMYHYFDSKESLLQAVFQNCMIILSEAFAEATNHSEPQERLAALLGTIFALLESDRDFWGLFYMMRTQPAIMELLGDSFREWTARLRDLFTAELQAAGRQEPEVDALMLYSLIEGTIQQYLLDPPNYPLELIVETIISQYTPQETV
jgi:AcrR family transcriptional regulator